MRQPSNFTVPNQSLRASKLLSGRIGRKNMYFSNSTDKPDPASHVLSHLFFEPPFRSSKTAVGLFLPLLPMSRAPKLAKQGLDNGRYFRPNRKHYSGT